MYIFHYIVIHSQRTIPHIALEIMEKERPDKSYLNSAIWTLNENRYRLKGSDNKFSELMITALNEQSDMRTLSNPINGMLGISDKNIKVL